MINITTSMQPTTISTTTTTSSTTTMMNDHDISISSMIIDFASTSITTSPPSRSASFDVTTSMKGNKRIQEHPPRRPHRRGRKVAFNETDIFHQIPNLDDYSLEEYSSTWYTAEEFVADQDQRE